MSTCQRAEELDAVALLDEVNALRARLDAVECLLGTWDQHRRNLPRTAAGLVGVITMGLCAQEVRAVLAQGEV